MPRLLFILIFSWDRDKNSKYITGSRIMKFAMVIVNYGDGFKNTSLYYIRGRVNVIRSDDCSR